MKGRLTKKALQYTLRSDAEDKLNLVGKEIFEEGHISIYRLISNTLKAIKDEDIIVVNYDCQNKLLNYFDYIDYTELENGKFYVVLFNGFVTIYDLVTVNNTLMIYEEDFFSLINPFVLNEFFENKLQEKEKTIRRKI